MLSPYNAKTEDNVHSDEIQQIITTIPPWLLRWGVLLFFILLVMMLSLSVFISYPDIVKTTLKISSSGNNQFYGEMKIQQDQLIKVKEGQDVLIKLKRYPSQEYGLIKGKISMINDISDNGNRFTSKVEFNPGLSPILKHVHLRNGMLADAEIITQDATLLQRLCKSIFKKMDINKDMQ
ncbi:hypothetical protein [Pedobacter sp. L105]|uniref:hypothetical protein n=1 Tax=Pedobacter sp. L105 TaxID=1641871 RepID=UPI00131BA3C1|nr:hypothetical protein [Pedobacter sp. L105]